MHCKHRKSDFAFRVILVRAEKNYLRFGSEFEIIQTYVHKFRSSHSQGCISLHWFKRRLYNVLKAESFLRTALIVLLGPRLQTSVWSDGSWLSSASSFVSFFFFFLHSLQDTSVPKWLHNQSFDCDSRMMTMSIPAHTADGTFIHTSHITLHDTVQQHILRPRSSIQAVRLKDNSVEHMSKSETLSCHQHIITVSTFFYIWGRRRNKLFFFLIWKTYPVEWLLFESRRTLCQIKLEHVHKMNI